MKRDIRINFSMLDGICSKTYTYMNALENMKSSLKKLYDRLDSENSGKSIDALKKLYMEVDKQIDQCYREVKDIHDIFRGYIEEMQGIIAPKNYSEMMQVDRNDIWWNMEAIAGASEAIGLLKYERETYESFPSLDDSEEEIENQRRNGREIEEICGIIDRYRNRLTDCMDDMNGLYRNRVVPYEDKDDEYARKAKKFYDKYTNTWERICDRTSSINRSINDVFEGLISSIGDMVTGLVGLGIGIVTYIPAGIGLAVTKVTGDAPDFLEDCIEKTKGYNEMIGAILNDSALMVEGLGQNISDAWEEKGVAYCTGYATGEILQAVVLKKVNISKLNTVDDVSVISKSDIIIKGKKINVADTLVELGVSNEKVTSFITKVSSDDLKKLYVYIDKNPNALETNRVIDKILKGDSVDDVIKVTSKARKIDVVNDADIISDVKNIRQSLPSRYKTSGNLATAEVSIDGINQNKFFSHSGIDKMQDNLIGKADNISVQPENPMFKAIEAANKNGEFYLRDSCTEYKILNDIADRLKDSVNPSGKIKLFTELEPCDSCKNVIDSFKNEFKNIEIEVIHNGDIRVIPKNGY